MTEKCLIKIVGWGVGGEGCCFLEGSQGRSQRVLSKSKDSEDGREEVGGGGWETVPNAHYFLKG